MNHNQQASLVGHPDYYEALFADGVIRVWNRNGKRVIEDGARLRKNPTPCFRRFADSFFRSHSKAIRYIYGQV
jgi:hypothetical protein